MNGAFHSSEQDNQQSVAQQREALLKLVNNSSSAGDSCESPDRVEALQQLLTPAVCRRLGIYRLPENFLLSVVIMTGLKNQGPCDGARSPSASERRSPPRQ